MKKSGKNLSAQLLIISLASVMALTACERRERPVKAKAGQTASLGEEKRTTPDGETTTDGSTTPNVEKAGTPAEAFAQSVAALDANAKKLVEDGYVLDHDAKIFDITAPWEKIADSSDEATKDIADQHVACQLKAALELHEAFIRDHAGAKAEGVSEVQYTTYIELTQAMIEALKNTIHNKAELERATCETAPVAPKAEAVSE
jgi:hypothetical protein